jgi:electron transfer flavoprotein alpha subunit
MILAIAETRDGRLMPSAAEAIAAAQAMAGEVAGVLLGAPAAADELAAFDLTEVLSIEHEALAAYTADAFTAALTGIVRDLRPRCVVMSHTYQARDYAPCLAAGLSAALVPDCTAVRADGETWRFTRPLFGGKLNAEVIVDEPAPFVVTFQAGAFGAERVGKGSAPAPIRRLVPSIDPASIRQKPEAPFQETRPTVDLAHAERIVAVGRGIKNREQLPVVEALAAKLGAELAASRPICDAGWLPMDRQVGSSGQTVRPRLYVAVGVSGAIQHIVGMRGSRTIVAINTDPDAPIFEIADFGIVGDLFEIVPAIVAALKE